MAWLYLVAFLSDAARTARLAPRASKRNLYLSKAFLSLSTLYRLVGTESMDPESDARMNSRHVAQFNCCEEPRQPQIAWPKLYFYKLGSRGERERGGKKKAKEKKAVSIFMRPAPNGSIF